MMPRHSACRGLRIGMPNFVRERVTRLRGKCRHDHGSVFADALTQRIHHGAEDR